MYGGYVPMAYNDYLKKMSKYCAIVCFNGILFTKILILQYFSCLYAFFWVHELGVANGVIMWHCRLLQIGYEELQDFPISPFTFCKLCWSRKQFLTFSIDASMTWLPKLYWTWGNFPSWYPMWIVVCCFSVKLYVRNIVYTVAVNIRKITIGSWVYSFFYKRKFSFWECLYHLVAEISEDVSQNWNRITFVYYKWWIRLNMEMCCKWISERKL